MWLSKTVMSVPSSSASAEPPTAHSDGVAAGCTSEGSSSRSSGSSSSSSSSSSGSATAPADCNPFASSRLAVDQKLVMTSPLFRDAASHGLFQEVIAFHGGLLCPLVLGDVIELSKRYIHKASMEFRAVEFGV